MLRPGQKRKSCRCRPITPASDKGDRPQLLCELGQALHQLGPSENSNRLSVVCFTPLISARCCPKARSRRASKRRWDDDNESLQPHLCKSLGPAAVLHCHSQRRESLHVAWGSTCTLKLYVVCLSRPRAKGEAGRLTSPSGSRIAIAHNSPTSWLHGCIAVRWDTDANERYARAAINQRMGELFVPGLFPASE